MASHEISRRGIILAPALAPLVSSSAPPSGASSRGYWTATLAKIASPVLESGAKAQLKSSMPIEAHPGTKDRAQYTHLEAVGRLLCGMAPWLESQATEAAESKEKNNAAGLARRTIANIVDPKSLDFLNFNQGRQPVVDAAFLALALLRAPHELWEKLDAGAKQNLVTALRSSRVILPGFNNWLLFSATIEAFFAHIGEPWDQMRVDYALRQHEEWYKGDGIYGDGPQFHWDYYNSFVIHPMLLAVADVVSQSNKAWQVLQSKFLERSKRYAVIQERLIGVDGSYPTIGRSLAYRCGAFQLLADIAVRRQLPQEITAAQVRCALEAVIRRTMDAPQTFTSNGWLQIGVCGHQPSIGEAYISTGSLYLCSAAFLPLGLPASDGFWAAPDEDWTSRKVWSGQQIPIDHALSS